MGVMQRIGVIQVPLSLAAYAMPDYPDVNGGGYTYDQNSRLPIVTPKARTNGSGDYPVVLRYGAVRQHLTGISETVVNPTLGVTGSYVLAECIDDWASMIVATPPVYSGFTMWRSTLPKNGSLTTTLQRQITPLDDGAGNIGSLSKRGNVVGLTGVLRQVGVLPGNLLTFPGASPYPQRFAQGFVRTDNGAMRYALWNDSNPTYAIYRNGYNFNGYSNSQAFSGAGQFMTYSYGGRHYSFLGASSDHPNWAWNWVDVPYVRASASAPMADQYAVFFDDPILETEFTGIEADNRISLWHGGFIVRLDTNGTGPTGQRYEIAIVDPTWSVYYLMKFVPMDAAAALAMTGAFNEWIVKIDENGIVYFSTGQAAQRLQVIYSFGFNLQTPLIQFSPPPVTLPCFSPCTPAITLPE